MSRLVIVQKYYLRDIEVEVTDEQYAALHQTEDVDARSAAESFVIDTAITKEEENNLPLEWWMTSVTDEEDEEVFDVCG